MSFSRRPAAGLATVGATVLAALALGGSPATATDLAVKAGHAILTPSPDTGDKRGNAGYGADREAPRVTAPAATTPAPGSAAAQPAAATSAPTRGRPGYSGLNSTPPTPTPSKPSASGTVKVVTPSGVSSQTAAPVTGRAPGGAGVSSGEQLPLTGAPLSGTLALGALMVAGGASAVWYTRRRRNA